jgi:hypothetical protein
MNSTARDFRECRECRECRKNNTPAQFFFASFLFPLRPLRQRSYRWPLASQPYSAAAPTGKIGRWEHNSHGK